MLLHLLAMPDTIQPTFFGWLKAFFSQFAHPWGRLAVCGGIAAITTLLALRAEKQESRIGTYANKLAYIGIGLMPFGIFAATWWILGQLHIGGVKQETLLGPLAPIKNVGDVFVWGIYSLVLLFGVVLGAACYFTIRSFITRILAALGAAVGVAFVANVASIGLHYAQH